MYRYGNLQYRNPQSPTGLPLCPEAKIVLSHPSDKSIVSIPVPAIIDTGAVMTVVPEEIIQNLRPLLKPLETRSFRMANNQSGELLVYLLYIRVIDTEGNTDFQDDIKVVSVPGKEYAAIGRDILNKHKAVFNAPRQIWGFNCNEQNCTFS